MSAPLDILLVRPWTADTERLRTSIRAAGLTARITRVDFAAALFAALTWGTFNVIVYDRTTPGVTPEELAAAVRERSPATPVIELGASDLGQQLVALLARRRN